MGKLDAKAPLADYSRPYEGIGLFADRKPQKHSLNDALVISVDNHLCLGGEDFFYENAPASLKDRVPRVLFDEKYEIWATTMGGKWLYPFGSEALATSVETRLGSWNVEQRVLDMDAEGVDKEIAFPQLLMGLFTYKDFEAREYILLEYNRYLCRLQRRAPGRFYGVGIGNYWDPANAKSWIKEMKDQGFITVMLPLRAGFHPNGDEVVYASDEMKPMWAAIEDADMTVSFHVGEVGGPPGPGGFAAGVLNFLGPTDFRQLYGKLVFGGVLDDFPKLRIVFSEANIAWVAGLLQDANMIPESFPAALFDRKLKLRPSEYWHRNCYAAFMHDPAGMRLLDVIGVKTIMWSADYPHNEGTFGYSGDAIQSFVDEIGEDNTRLIIGLNARECYKI